MDNENKHDLAVKMFSKVCRTMDAHEWTYDKYEDLLTVKSGAQGDDLPIDFRIEVDEKRRFMMLVSPLPFTTPEDRRVEMAMAVSVVNFQLADGSFAYNIQSGRMYFRMTCSYIDSDLGDDLFDYLLFCSVQTIDEYNEKLMMLSAGVITLEKFIELVDG